MFDIGWTEILLIAVVAIIIVGPKDLPRMLRSLGQYAGKLRRMAGDFRSQFDEAVRESELDELRSTFKDASSANPVNQVRDSVNEGLNPLKDTASEIKSGIESPDEGGKARDASSGGASADTSSSSGASAQEKTQSASSGNKASGKSAAKSAPKGSSKAKSAQQSGASGKRG